MKCFSDFIDFNAEEFAALESFQAFVFHRNEDDIAFWQDFISSHPGKLPEITEASRLLTSLKFKPLKVGRQVKQDQLNRLLAALPVEAPEQPRRGNSENVRLYQLIAQSFTKLQVIRMAAAVSFLALICCAAFYLRETFLDSDSVTYRTQYGENATYLLPDSTVVILNGNSSLVHGADWDQDRMREVWLEGEAFFDVKHRGMTAKSRFIVHTQGMDVEVLGTKFNVFNRKDKVNVVLNSGKVKVRIADSPDTSAVVMMPDEALEFSRKDLTLTRKQVKAEMLTSWRNQVLVFDNTPLSRIGEMIENTYGLRVVFRDSVDATEKLAGTVPCESLDVLLDVLAKSSNLSITRKADQIIIAKQQKESTYH